MGLLTWLFQTKHHEWNEEEIERIEAVRTLVAYYVRGIISAKQRGNTIVFSATNGTAVKHVEFERKMFMRVDSGWLTTTIIDMLSKG